MTAKEDVVELLEVLLAESRRLEMWHTARELEQARREAILEANEESDNEPHTRYPRPDD